MHAGLEVNWGYAGDGRVDIKSASSTKLTRGGPIMAMCCIWYDVGFLISAGNGETKS